MDLHGHHSSCKCLFILLAYRITAVGSHRSRWVVEFEIVFVEKTNFLLRKSIEAGERFCSLKVVEYVFNSALAWVHTPRIITRSKHR